MQSTGERLLPMGRIQVLPEGVANRIAAGEVVERPASVAKELIENALDAEATEIEISVKRAGLDELMVTDNGWGMDREDVLLAFRRHATSKIETAKDLQFITHLGFRGEALPSIASVARVEVLSKRDDRDEGVRYQVDGGKAGESMPAARERGTTIKIRSLFFNVPARRKFLRTPATEYGHIVTGFKRYAVAYPELHWKLNKDGSEVYDLAPTDLRGRILQLFGDEAASHLHEVSERSGDVVLSGYVGGEGLFKRSRGDQFLFVNRRPFQSSSLHHAVVNGFGPLIQPGEVPFYVLLLRLDPEEFDVNVHPAKHEVRFRDESQVYRTVLMGVRGALGVAIKKGDSPVKLRPAQVRDGRGYSGHDLMRPTPAGPRDHMRELNLMYGPRGKKTGDSEDSSSHLRDAGFPDPRSDSERQRQGGPVIGFSGDLSSTAEPSAAGPSSQQDHRSSHSQPVPASQAPLAGKYDPHEGDPLPAGPAPDAGALSHAAGEKEGRPGEGQRTNVWQLHRTYILSQVKSGLVIIDQHVAHERILYEKALAAMRDRPWNGQQLLFPVAVQVEPADAAILEEMREGLARTGLEIEPLSGRDWAIKSVPAGIRIKNEEKLLLEIVTDYRNQYEIRLDPQERLAASFACKAAIKAGDPLNLDEMNALIDELFLTQYPFVCPHGRPVVVNLTLHDLHALFGRE
ncbi:DNA mismatch repair endonuclease MutL [bacterium]|nr:DNA mismatch repair endonuclease MutL [bacterium]